MRAERSSAKGYWLAEAGPVAASSPASGSADFDTVIVGGGYTGLWTAWFLIATDPSHSVAIVEADVCGEGPSGRNGGIVNPLWDAMPTLVERYGEGAAAELGSASARAVEEIGAWSAANGVDCHYQAHPLVEVAATRAQQGRWRSATSVCADLGLEGRYREASEAEIQAHCASPVFLGGAIMRPGATVQPALLARGLRRLVIEAGARVFERSPVKKATIGRRGARVQGPGFDFRASRVVLAVNSRLASWPGFRTRLSTTSSHMVITEPVPELLEEYGWDGAPVTDHQTLLHYLRTTHDGRIAIGWGGGVMGLGGRVSGRMELDWRAQQEAIRALRRFFPSLCGRAIAHGWGGPIDVSPIHVPIIGQEDRCLFAFGYTGNGIGPSRLAGEVLAALALDQRSALTRLAIVNSADIPRFPPEPFRFVGGSLIRHALTRKDLAEQRGRRPGRLVAGLASLPRRLNLSLPR